MLDVLRLRDQQIRVSSVYIRPETWLGLPSEASY